MRYCRFLLDDQAHYGVVEDRDAEPCIVDLARAPEEDLTFRLTHGRATSWTFSFEPGPLSAVTLLPPVTPSKIVCVGRNYREHVKEMGSDLPTEPLIFLKPPSSLLAPGGIVRMPAASARVDYEGELALVIGRPVRNLKPEDWRSAIRGYTLANDVTARDLQAKDDQWTRAKGFDTFCPIGPWVSNEIDPEAGFTLETSVNGELRQHGFDPRLHLSHSRPARPHHVHHDSRTRRPHPHRNSFRSGGAQGWRPSGGEHPRPRRPGQHLPAGRALNRNGGAGPIGFDHQAKSTAFGNLSFGRPVNKSDNDPGLTNH